MSINRQVIFRLPGFSYTLFHYSFLSLFCDYQAAIRLLVLLSSKS